MANDIGPQRATPASVDQVQAEFASEADFIDRFKEYLSIKLEHWMFNPKVDQSSEKAIQSFVCWVTEDVEKDKHAKRNTFDNPMSYEDARQQVQAQPNQAAPSDAGEVAKTWVATRDGESLDARADREATLIRLMKEYDRLATNERPEILQTILELVDPDHYIGGIGPQRATPASVAQMKQDF